MSGDHRDGGRPGLDRDGVPLATEPPGLPSGTGPGGRRRPARLAGPEAVAGGRLRPAGRETLLLEIHDDGQGFDVDAPTVGVGLSNMSERVRALHGTLEVRSSPGAGTTIRAAIPLERPGTAVTDGARRVRRGRARLLLAVLAVVCVAGLVLAAAGGSFELAAISAAGMVLAGAATLARGRRGPSGAASPAQPSAAGRPAEGSDR